MTLVARKIKVTIKCNASHNVPSRASFHKSKEVIGPGALCICILAIYYTILKVIMYCPLLIDHMNFWPVTYLWVHSRKTEGPRAYARYMGSSARAEWPTFLPS